MNKENKKWRENGSGEDKALQNCRLLFKDSDVATRKRKRRLGKNNDFFS